MAFQTLQGIQITPKGNYNVSRFGKDMIDGSWPTSFAYDGWVFNASCDIGFSNQPTEIRISIVLEVTDKVQKYTFFNIKDEDLKCDAGNGDEENLYDIDFNGVKFTDLILYEYSFSIEDKSKILYVTFKDYSLVLDKIYIGLLKRQGKEFIHSATSRLEFPVICPDCMLAGDSLKQPSFAERDLAYGSYVGINEKTYDNFKNIAVAGNIYKQWEALFEAEQEQPFFDLNGGYLIIGTEDATEERCGDLAPISYNFNQLLASLRMRGMQFEGAFPHASKDTDYFYKQNYIGPLREVLQQWCSDLGYDFYCQGKTLIGINLNKAIDIQNVVDIADPTTVMGEEFAANKNTAIVSYRSNSSLSNTFKQSVITASNLPRAIKVHSKSPKRYVGILPLHPIDLNRHSTSPVIRYDAFGNWFSDIAWANNFESSSTDRSKTLPELDNRTFGEIDISIALTHYDPNLRDIYCQDRALYGETLAIREANFKALGFVPLVELTGNENSQAKSMCIEATSPGGGDDVQSICLDKRFYRVFLGYYYPQFKQEIVSWEQMAGDGMYKYGIVTKGLLNKFPYMPQNTLLDMSPKEGIFGSQGTSLMRIQHSIEPGANQYYVMRQAPFKDLILYSGLMTPINLRLPAMPATTYRAGLFPTGLFYSELSNEWGTLPEHFKRAMSLNLDDPCAQDFAQNEGYTNMVNNIAQKQQDWKLEYFVPKFSADLSKIKEEVQIALQNLPTQTLYDKTVSKYYDLHYKYSQNCSKLHILVMTDTRNHPNFNFECTPKSTSYINAQMIQQYFDKERESIKRRVEMKTPTICDLSLLQEMCRNLLSTKFQLGPAGDSRYSCILDEDKWNWLEDGFTYPHLTRANSRGLHIRLTKNPVSNASSDELQEIFRGTDANGDFYYTDLINAFTLQQPAVMNYTIVYPISSTITNTNLSTPLNQLPYDPGNFSSVIYGLGGYYRGILTSTVDVENRSPEMNDVYGAPVNAKNNSAASIKIINNVVDSDLQPQLDPYSMRFWSYMTVITGDAQIITTVEKYHNMVQQLNNYEMTTPMKTVDLSLAGTPNDFGNFKQYLVPGSGLNKMSMAVGDNGVVTSLTFSDRAKTLPKSESILNKITPRMK